MKKLILFLVGSAIVVLFLITRMDEVSIFKKESSSQNHKEKKMQIKKEESKLFDNELSEISQSQKQPLPQQPTISFSLEIKGDEEFKTKVKNAIRLLWLYDKEGSFKLLRRYVFEIRQSNRTTFLFDGEKPVVELSNKMVSDSSITYLASVIAHNAWHGWYLTEKKLKKKRAKEVPPPNKERIEKNFIPPLPEPKRFEDLFLLEEEATRYQRKILEIINAPQSEIKKLLKRDKKDFSHAHDGNYIIDY